MPRVRIAVSGEIVVATRNAGIGADQRPHDRDHLGQRRDQGQQEGARQPDHGVGDAGRDAHRGHEDQLAADPHAEPRLDLVPGIADSGPPLIGGEGERVALQAGTLGQPEEDERQQRDQGRGDVADGQRHADDPIRVRRPTGLERRLDGSDQRADTVRQRLRPETACSTRGHGRGTRAGARTRRRAGRARRERGTPRRQRPRRGTSRRRSGWTGRGRSRRGPGSDQPAARARRREEPRGRRAAGCRAPRRQGRRAGARTRRRPPARRRGPPS